MSLFKLPFMRLFSSKDMRTHDYMQALLDSGHIPMLTAIGHKTEQLGEVRVFRANSSLILTPTKDKYDEWVVKPDEKDIKASFNFYDSLITDRDWQVSERATLNDGGEALVIADRFLPHHSIRFKITPDYLERNPTGFLYRGHFSLDGGKAVELEREVRGL